jgi:hemin uptake protein HemP
MNNPASLPGDDRQLNPRDLREVNSQDLMQGQKEIVIRHAGEAYRLSVTRAGKLILRK